MFISVTCVDNTSNVPLGRVAVRDVVAVVELVMLVVVTDVVLVVVLVT